MIRIALPTDEITI